MLEERLHLLRAALLAGQLAQGVVRRGVGGAAPDRLGEIRLGRLQLSLPAEGRPPEVVELRAEEVVPGVGVGLDAAAGPLHDRIVAAELAQELADLGVGAGVARVLRQDPLEDRHGLGEPARLLQDLLLPQQVQEVGRRRGVVDGDVDALERLVVLVVHQMQEGELVVHPGVRGMDRERLEEGCLRGVEPTLAQLGLPGLERLPELRRRGILVGGGLGGGRLGGGRAAAGDEEGETQEGGPSDPEADAGSHQRPSSSDAWRDSSRSRIRRFTIARSPSPRARPRRSVEIAFSVSPLAW